MAGYCLQISRTNMEEFMPKCKKCNTIVGMASIEDGECISCRTPINEKVKNINTAKEEKIGENRRVIGLALQVVGFALGGVIVWDYFQVTSNGYEWEWTNGEIIQIVIGGVIANLGHFIRSNKGLFKMLVGDKK
jgi:hypothetical protein